MDFNFLFLYCTKAHLTKPLHTLLLVSGRAQNVFFSTKLIGFYANFGDLRSSRLVFEKIPTKNIFSWNSMISAYVKNGYFREALNCYYRLLTITRFRPDFFTFPIVLKSCQGLGDGKRIHCWIAKLGCEDDVFVSTSLMHMYSRFGVVGDAHKLFNEIPVRDMGSWNAMISGFSQNGKAAEALAVFEEMQFQGDARKRVSL